MTGRRDVSKKRVTAIIVKKSGVQTLREMYHK